MRLVMYAVAMVLGNVQLRREITTFDGRGSKGRARLPKLVMHFKSHKKEYPWWINAKYFSSFPSQLLVLYQFILEILFKIRENLLSIDFLIQTSKIF